MNREWRALGTLIRSFDHQRVPVATSKRKPGPYPYYGASGIVDHVDDYLFDGEYLLISEDGENLRSRSTPIAFLANGRFWVNNHAHVVRGIQGIADTRFLSHMLAVTDISGNLSGSAQPKLSQASLNAIQILMPPFSEQEAIAGVLGALDDKIAANRQLAVTCEALMCALTQGMERSGHLADLVALSKAQVSADNLATMTVNHYSLPAFDEEKLALQEAGAGIRSNKFTLPGPSVLLSKLNPRFPRVWHVPRPAENSVASTEFLVLMPQELPSAAVWALLATPRTTAYLVEHAAGTSGSHQRVRPADALKLPVPSASQFSGQLLEQLVSLGDHAVLARSESRTLAQLRDTLLPALMDGRLRVRDAAEQVESAH